MIPLKHLHVVLIYLAVINVVTFFMYGIDNGARPLVACYQRGTRKL